MNTDETRKLKSSAKNQKLPNEVEMLLFVCSCFGIGVEELNQTLCRVRKNWSHSLRSERQRKVKRKLIKCFPRKLSPMMLLRAETGKRKWGEAIKIIRQEALRYRICYQNGEPLGSFTGKLTDELVFSLLSLYERLLPKLDMAGVLKKDVLWLLVENVFVPTVFIELAQAQRLRLGLGEEFQGENCWYLPLKSNGKILKPIQRVLDYWLRTSRLSTGYGAGVRFIKKSKIESDEKFNKRESLKKRFEHWRAGKNLPKKLNNLLQFVDQLKAEVSWLDEPDTWKARFTLAWAMQNICEEMDKVFYKNSSLKLAEMIKSISEEGIACARDDGKLIANSCGFFAMRLLQLRLQAEKKWKPSPPQGNWFLEEITQMAIADTCVRHRKGSVENHVMLDEYLFNIGIYELNRIFDERQKGAGE
ncbi:MAG: hypothetical protein ACREFE_00960 [Limisphaerales bacterium]